MTVTRLLLLGLAALLLWLGNALLRPFQTLPQPARMTCLPETGSRRPLGAPATIYGLGLSFAGHIAESPGLYDPETGPPVFVKRPRTVGGGDVVRMPTRADLLAAVGELDAAHAAELGTAFETMPALLDYEVEVGLVVLSSFETARLEDPAFVPPLGYFVANDVTARILIATAPDVAHVVEYLAAGKSLPGFLPVGDTAWIPDTATPDAGPCVRLVTEVNGERRQDASFTDIILTPKQILAEVARQRHLTAFAARDWIITGTPPGVAAQVPAWQQRLMVLLDPPASLKVRLMAGAAANPRYLRPGDRVTVSAGHLGTRTVRIDG
jgi:2-keto-4-pentenoate hydratase/2-oxohepta-3-ene-1,7-dioic acid hydratase in catechol pathway